VELREKTQTADVGELSVCLSAGAVAFTFKVAAKIAAKMVSSHRKAEPGNPGSALPLTFGALTPFQPASSKLYQLQKFGMTHAWVSSKYFDDTQTVLKRLTTWSGLTKWAKFGIFVAY
jgi:hypothetical protein